MCLTSLSNERFCLIKLDDSNILQRDHLVRDRLSFGRMICSTLKTLASHGSDCSNDSLVVCATNEHLAWLDLRENSNILRCSVPPYVVWAMVFDYPIRQFLNLHHTATTLKSGHTQEKYLAQHTE
jgi:hypothetical protein